MQSSTFAHKNKHRRTQEYEHTCRSKTLHSSLFRSKTLIHSSWKPSPLQKVCCLQKLALCVSGLENQNIRSAPYSRLRLEWGLRILSVFARREDVQCGARWPSGWREWSQHWGNKCLKATFFLSSLFIHLFTVTYIALSYYVSSTSVFNFFIISTTSTPLMIVLAFVGGSWCMEEGLGAAQTVQQILWNVVKYCEILWNIVKYC